MRLWIRILDIHARYGTHVGRDRSKRYPSDDRATPRKTAPLCHHSDIKHGAYENGDGAARGRVGEVPGLQQSVDRERHGLAPAETGLLPGFRIGGKSGCDAPGRLSAGQDRTGSAAGVGRAHQRGTCGPGRGGCANASDREG